MLSIRTVSPSEKELLKKITEIHLATFQGFFLTFMGKRFLRYMYQSYAEHPESGLLVAEENDTPVGFLAYSEAVSNLYRYMFRRHFFPFAWYGFLAALRRPAAFFHILRAFKKPKEAERTEPYVYLASIGVLPEEKSKGIGSSLISTLKERVDFSRFSYIMLETDAENNNAALGFYQKNGFAPAREYETPEGRKMVEFRFGETCAEATQNAQPSRKEISMSNAPLIALLTNNDDDIYCFRLELIQSLLANGYRVLISCPDGPKFGAMEEFGLRKNQEFLYDNPPIDRRGTSVKKDLKLILHYRALFKKYKPAVILAYTAKPNVYGGLVASLRRIPVINNVTGLGSVLKEKGLTKKFIMWLFKMAYRRSACIMFQNSTNMQLAIDLGWVKGDRRLIPGSGVALSRYPVEEYPEGGNGIEGKPIVFNYIGRILREKGVDNYMEAARRIKEKYPNTEFNMLGFIEPTEVRYHNKLAEFEKNGFIRYHGPQLDVRPWIKRAHAIIHPSIYGEGMSNVLLENASSGRPIITTDNPGCKETVDDGVTGFLYHGGNVDELVEKIEHFIADLSNDERKQMGLAGREKMEREFSREVVIRAYLEKIGEVTA
ncbi:MAG: GNAT family N-acetyltransferase [Clostridia bacterium]|nr:GNAT family N-acetyltransferase [Clostridia bacterium]